MGQGNWGSSKLKMFLLYFAKFSRPPLILHSLLEGARGAGACPSCLQARGGVHPGWVASSVHGQHVERDKQAFTHMVSTPKCMFLDCRRKPVCVCVCVSVMCAKQRAEICVIRLLSQKRSNDHERRPKKKLKKDELMTS